MTEFLNQAHNIFSPIFFTETFLLQKYKCSLQKKRNTEETFETNKIILCIFKRSYNILNTFKLLFYSN